MAYEFASELAKEQELTLRIAVAAGAWRRAAVRMRRANKAWIDSSPNNSQRDEGLWEQYKSLEHLVEGLLGECAMLADSWTNLKTASSLTNAMIKAERANRPVSEGRETNAACKKI